MTNHIEVLRQILDGTPRDTLHEDNRAALTEAIAALSAPEASGAGDGESAMWALRQILHDLPTRRDWLCPDVEKVARAIVARNPYADLTAALQPAATSEGENNV